MFPHSTSSSESLTDSMYIPTSRLIVAVRRWLQTTKHYFYLFRIVGMGEKNSHFNVLCSYMLHIFTYEQEQTDHILMRVVSFVLSLSLSPHLVKTKTHYHIFFTFNSNCSTVGAPIFCERMYNKYMNSIDISNRWIWMWCWVCMFVFEIYLMLQPLYYMWIYWFMS